MYTLTISLILSVGLTPDHHDTKVSTVLSGYIEWTKTGEACHGDIFSDRVKMSYLTKTNEFEMVSFEDYSSYIEIAASAIPRTMQIKRIDTCGDVVKAVITDSSEDHLFSLVHILTLVEESGSWKIQSIQIFNNE
ncbi:MAG: nuclear transport factor 2 family protein [Bacteroidota bacterium]